MNNERAPMDVVLSFDVDAETLWEARDADSSSKPVWLSQGTYGPRVGLPRILRLLDRYRVDASFFVPGVVIQRYPAEIGTIVEGGYEIGHHSHTHTWAQNLSEEAEREEFDTAYRAIENFTGQRPRGYRSPAAEFTPNTLKLMLEYEFDYSSNMFDGDSPHRLTVNGRETDILEFPFSWALDDAPYFLYSNKLPGRVIAPSSAVLETWALEFDQLSREPDRCLVVAMHPQLIGRPSRLWVLEQFIEHVLTARNATFTSFSALTDRLRAAPIGQRYA